ncbi:MAG: hypothetical protein ACO3O7_05190 [Ilumatobacteraceae bacterium]
MDLVDLVGMESPGDRANKAIQVVPDPVFRAAKTTRGLLARVATTTARHVPGGMMIALGSVVMMTVRRVLVVMMTVRRVLVVMMTVQFVGVVTMLVRRVLAGMMTVQFVGVVTMLVRRVLAGMMIVLGSVVMMTVRRVPVVMTDRLAHVQLPSRRPMRFAIGVAVAA